jgi:hypothetical protein
MEPSARAAPEPKTARTGATRGILVGATLLSGGVGANCLMPWHTASWMDPGPLRGVTYIEGIVDLVLAAACFSLFLAALLVREPKRKARLAMIGTIVAFGMAATPVVLYARMAWQGHRSVYVIGSGYGGWVWGIYLAMVNGFVAAALGGLGAGRLAVRKVPAPVKLEALRRKPAE